MKDLKPLDIEQACGINACGDIKACQAVYRTITGRYEFAAACTEESGCFIYDPSREIERRQRKYRGP